MIKTAIMWHGSPACLATDVFDLLKSEVDREEFLDALAKRIGCSKTALHDKIIREKEQVIEKLCAELDTHQREIDKKVIARADHLLRPNKTPADRLADVAAELLPRLRDGGRTSSADDVRLADAINDYKSTRNGVGMTMDRAFGSPPDPILVARYLLDCLTGGALASLICMVRDEVLFPRSSGADMSDSARLMLRDNLKSNLRALGEKIE